MEVDHPVWPNHGWRHRWKAEARLSRAEPRLTLLEDLGICDGIADRSRPGATTTHESADDRTMANLDVALEEACRSLPHGGDHEIRREIAQKLLDCAVQGNRTLSRLTEVARAALAEAIKKSA
ncbi:hypothetical protein ABID65_008776 [Bradyrhizobium sp. S3.9.2]|uniref:hypothetical protein n=2 Tax=Bradyrhizobium TaxID=374 RepID=UPI00339978EE